MRDTFHDFATKLGKKKQAARGIFFSIRASRPSIPAKPGQVGAFFPVGRVGVEALPGLRGHGGVVGLAGFDGADVVREEPVEPLFGFHQLAVPGRPDLKVLALHRRGIELQPAFARPLHHPAQGDVREAGIPVAPADIGMHARKPDLLQPLAVGPFLLPPHAGLEGAAALVDGQGLEGVVDAAAQLHIVEFDIQELVDHVEVPRRDAQRPHGVPHADAVDADLTGIGSAEKFGLDGLREGFLVAAAVEHVSVIQLVQVVRAQEPRVAQQSGKAAHGVGPAAEAEKENVVTVLVLFHQKSVRLQDVPRNPHPGNPAPYPVIPMRAHAGIVIEHLPPAISGKVRHGHGEPGNIGRRNHPFILLVRSVPGAVGTDDNAFGHITSLESRLGSAKPDEVATRHAMYARRQ